MDIIIVYDYIDFYSEDFPEIKKTMNYFFNNGLIPPINSYTYEGERTYRISDYYFSESLIQINIKDV